MRLFLISIFVLLVHTGLIAKSCSEYEAAYDIAQYTMQEEGRVSYRKSYDLSNALIDTATSYLAYCNTEISLADQYQIMQVIKRTDQKRREYFKGAVREYHAIYGIRPNVREIYQDGSYSTGGGGTSGSSSPPRFPPVQQPQFPPVQK